MKHQLEKIAFHLRRDRFPRAVKAPSPTHIQIEPTVRCNLKCVTCTRETVIGTYAKTDMSLADIEKILRLFPRLEAVKFQGLGEPLFTHGLEPMLQRFAERDIRLWIITNGTTLHNEAHRKLLLRYFRDVTVSIDSVRPDLFARLRVGAQLEQVAENVRWLLRDRRASGGGPAVGINFCVSPENVDEIEDIAPFAAGLGLDYVSLVAAENWTTAQEAGHDRYAVFARELQARSADIKKAVSRLRRRLLMRGIVVGYKDSQRRLGRCFWPFSSLFINVEGKITPCCLRMHGGNAVGSIHDVETLDQVWNGPAYQALRVAHLEKDASNPVCGQCPF
jgi:MoaA/NifB/PqqE/SkfB family radical SAM enzyme